MKKRKFRNTSNIFVALGAIAAIIIIFTFHPKRPIYAGLSLREKIGRLDLLGGFCLVCGVVSLQLALQWGGFQYAWSNSKVWGCLLNFGLMMIIFIVLQIRAKEK